MNKISKYIGRSFANSTYHNDSFSDLLVIWKTDPSDTALSIFYTSATQTMIGVVSRYLSWQR